MDLYYIQIGGESVDYFSWVPERITELRMQKGVSARDMSLSLGQSESYINKIENRRTLPSMAGFLYICEYLDITPQQFFDADAHTIKPAETLRHELERLSPAQAEHILQVIRDLNEKNM